MAKEKEPRLKEPYSRVLIPENDGSYFAEILEFPGCIAMGTTADEAVKNLDEAANEWIKAARAQGQEIPEPFANQGFSGKLALRLPRSLHRQATRFAERDGTSLNQFLISAIAARVGAEDAVVKIMGRLGSTTTTWINFQQNNNVVMLFEPKEQHWIENLTPTPSPEVVGVPKIQMISGGK
jgi:predicted RNase H-like HicB family nuclease